MKVKISRCKTGVTAHVVFEADSARGVQKNFVIFDEQIRKIVSGDSSLSWEEKLLNCGKIKIYVSVRSMLLYQQLLFDISSFV